jgi:hypothetical protein
MSKVKHWMVFAVPALIVGITAYLMHQREGGSSSAVPTPATSERHEKGANGSETDRSMVPIRYEERPVAQAPAIVAPATGLNEEATRDPALKAAESPPGMEDLVRSRSEYEAMSLEQLRQEAETLSKLQMDLRIPIHQQLYESGQGIYVCRSDETAKPPLGYEDKLYSFHQTGGIDGIYMTVLDQSQYPDLYYLRDAWTLINAVEHEKLHMTAQVPK